MRILTLAIVFVGGVVVARLLGAQGRGFYQVAVSGSLLGASLAGFSAELGMARVYAATNGRPSSGLSIKNTVVSAGGLWALILTLFGAALLVAPPFSMPVGSSLTLALLMSAALMSVYLQRLLLLDSQPLAAAAVPLIEAIGFLIGVGGYEVFGQLTEFGTVAARLGGSLVSLGFALVRLKPKFSGIDRSIAGRIARSGLSFYPGQLALNGLVRADVLILGMLSGLASAGVYSVAVSLAAPLLVLGTSVSAHYLQAQLEDTTEKARTTTQAIRRSLVLSVGGAALLAIVGPFLIPIVWGSEFEQAVLPLEIVLVGVVAASIQRPIGNYFIRQGMSSAANSRAIIALGIELIFCVLLVPTQGAVGAAIASSVAYLAYALQSWVSFSRNAGVNFRDVLKKD